MRSAARAFFVFVLVFGATFGGTACSSGGSKISQSEIGRLDAANGQVSDSLQQLPLAMDSCLVNQASNRHEQSWCRTRAMAKYLTGMNSALSVYLQIAGGTDGECQRSLSMVARDIRSLMTVKDPDIKQMKKMHALGEPSSSEKPLMKHADDAVPGACHFKFALKH